jgi:hypothetical protein
MTSVLIFAIRETNRLKACSMDLSPHQHSPINQYYHSCSDSVIHHSFFHRLNRSSLPFVLSKFFLLLIWLVSHSQSVKGMLEFVSLGL